MHLMIQTSFWMFKRNVKATNTYYLNNKFAIYFLYTVNYYLKHIKKIIKHIHGYFLIILKKR